MPRPPARSALLVVSLAPLVFLSACREGTEPGFRPHVIPVAAEGNQGCNGSVVPGVVATVAALAWVGPDSHLAADETDEVLYVTGADGSVRELDLSMGAPVERIVVAAGVIDSLLVTAGIATAARPSGIAILDATSLLVVERTSNTLLLVGRLASNQVVFFAGLPSETGGFVDGFGAQARFDFSAPSSLVPAGLAAGDPLSGVVFVADPGNQAVRLVTPGLLPSVSTLVGDGQAEFRNGDLLRARFDTPTGVALRCTGDLLVSERGGAGSGGDRVRRVELSVFGGLSGRVRTLAGDGVAQSREGVGDAASTSAPVAPVTTADGEVYWIDAGTGALRRFDPLTGVADCPLAADCASAGVAFGAPGTSYDLAVGASDALYVLNGDGQMLYRVTP